MARKLVPYIVVIDHGEESEPMTTDVAVEMFDFGDVTEETLDAIVETLEPGEETTVACALREEERTWTIAIRRVPEES